MTDTVARRGLPGQSSRFAASGNRPQPGTVAEPSRRDSVAAEPKFYIAMQQRFSAVREYYGGPTMPVVTVEMYEGRSDEQKQELVEDITNAMVDNVDASPETLHVIIHDVPKENWGRDGLLGIHRED